VVKTQQKSLPTYAGTGTDDLAELVAAPADRRIMLHIMQEVRRHHKLSVRFGFSVDPGAGQRGKEHKAGVLSVRFISTANALLPPSDTQLRQSERYGHYMYFGAAAGTEYGEFEHEFDVPYHANKFVVTLMPFTNPTTKLTAFSIAVEQRS
jgi:hypothetical protein